MAERHVFDEEAWEAVEILFADRIGHLGKLRPTLCGCWVHGFYIRRRGRDESYSPDDPTCEACVLLEFAEKAEDDSSHPACRRT